MDIKRSAKGFTLLELLLVVAIIGIVAGAIMVGISGQRESAQESRALAEMSAMIQPIMMCISDGNELKGGLGGSTGGRVICKDSSDNDLPTYGYWPVIGSGALSGFPSYAADLSIWYFAIEDDSVKVCCNKKSLKCGIIGKEVGCQGAVL